MTGLAPHGLRLTAYGSRLTDRHRPVRDVCAGRAGHQEVSEAREEVLGVVPGESPRGIEAAPARPENCLSIGESSGGFRAAVDTVGARGEDGDSGSAFEGERRAEREFEGSTAAAVPTDPELEAAG